MTSLFSDYPESIENISEVVKMCNFKLPKFKYHLPSFSNPSDKDDKTYFNDLCVTGLNDYLSLSDLEKDIYQYRL